MPGLNGTGPKGQGSKTGSRAGRCGNRAGGNQENKAGSGACRRNGQEGRGKCMRNQLANVNHGNEGLNRRG